MFTLVAKWQVSGHSQLAFANDHKISVHTLKYWIYKYRKQNESSDGFIRLEQITTPEICLRYPNGVELLIPVQTPIEVLRELVKIES